jgi:hypothetical protein
MHESFSNEDGLHAPAPLSTQHMHLVSACSMQSIMQCMHMRSVASGQKQASMHAAANSQTCCTALIPRLKTRSVQKRFCLFLNPNPLYLITTANQQALYMFYASLHISLCLSTLESKKLHDDRSVGDMDGT